MIDQMSKVTSSPVIAIAAAGATLANPGAFIVLALKDISELNPSAAKYAGVWVLFALVSLLPLLVALLALVVAPDLTGRVLKAGRGWLERHARPVAAVILILLAVSLLKHGIAGLAS
jgi:Sap-like sulfolipid-1-addressing protein